MKAAPILAIVLALISLCLPACDKHKERSEGEQHKIVVTSPKVKDVSITQRYVCQIHSQRFTALRAMQAGYLEKLWITDESGKEVPLREGQAVKEGQVLFKVMPILYSAKRDAEQAEADLAQKERDFTNSLARDKVVSPNELQLYDAKLAKAKAKVALAQAELDFTKVKAPFDGIIDRLHEQQGSLVKERDVLTTLSDNSLMWVYFNVPEKQYIEYQKTPAEEKERQRIELLLAQSAKFEHRGKDDKEAQVVLGKIGAISAKFNNETGTVPFRADFPNPDRLLRHGMTGTVLISKTLHDAIVIPQGATFEVLDKRYVFVIDKDGKPHRREIVVQNELDDVYVIAAYREDRGKSGTNTSPKMTGLRVDEKFVYEGVRQVHDDEKVEDLEFRPPDQVLANLKRHAE